MEDVILWILAEIAEAFLEAFFEYVLVAIFDLCWRVLKELFNPTLPNALPTQHLGGQASIAYGVFGFAAGCVSLVFFPHPLVRPSRIHGINLLVSPVIAGIMMSLTGAFFRRKEKTVLELESFGYGFAFAFGIALARLLLTK